MDIWTNKKVSPSGSLNAADLERWAKNLLIFSAPLLLIFLTQLQAGKDVKDALPIVYGALIQAVIDLLKKLLDGKK